MNKFTIIFLFLFFLAAIAVGVIAVRERLSLQGKGTEAKCPAQTLPSADFCPSGQEVKLSKDSQGCLSFTCR